MLYAFMLLYALCLYAFSNKTLGLAALTQLHALFFFMALPTN